LSDHTWRIWDKQNDWYMPFISKIKANKSHGYLLCPEEMGVYGRKRYSYLNSDTSKFTLIFGSYDYDWYRKNTDIYDLSNVSLKLWQDFFLYFSIKTATNLDYHPTNDIQCLFNCMNNRAHLHRVYLMDDLAELNLLKNNFYSWQDNDIDPKIFAMQYKPAHFNMKRQLLDGPYTHESQQYFPPQVYQSLINLITESNVDCPFITEKTFNCLLFGKMFIIYGYPGIHEKLTSMGFKLPYDIIDYESFDYEVNDRARSKKIAQELHRLTKTYKDLDKLHKSFIPLIKHNRNLIKDKARAQEGIPQEVFENTYYVDFMQEIKCRLDLLD